MMTRTNETEAGAGRGLWGCVLEPGSLRDDLALCL